MKTVQNEISLVCISITCQDLRLHSLIIVPSSTASVRLKAKVIKTLYFPSSRLWLGPFAVHFLKVSLVLKYAKNSKNASLLHVHGRLQ